MRQAKNKYYLKREHLINFNAVSDNTEKKSMIPKYLPDTVNNNKKYSLVLDLDETLVHFVAKEKKFKLRPGCV